MMTYQEKTKHVKPNSISFHLKLIEHGF
jgi:hypothetical protein